MAGSTLSSFGNDANGPFTIDNKIYQAVNNFSWIIGKHSLRMGGEYRYNQLLQIGNEFARDRFTHNGSFTGNGNTLARGDFRNSEIAFYLDDTYKLSRKLTLSLGLRYELAQPLLDQFGLQPNFQLRQPLPSVAKVADPNLHPVFVRTGGGVFFAQESKNSIFDMSRAAGGRANPVVDLQAIPTLSYSNYINTAQLPVRFAPGLTWGADNNLRTTYSLQYLLNVQRTLSESSVLEVGYTGNVSRRINYLINANAPLSGITPFDAREPYPEWHGIQFLNGDGIGNYNAFSAKLTQRLTSPMTAMFSYTWPKALDENSAIRGTGSDFTLMNPRCRSCDYSYAGFPHSNRRNGVSGVNPVASTPHPDRYFVREAFTNVTAGQFGNCARNALRAPSNGNVDFSARKDFKIHEAHTLQFRLEMFNAPNHPAWGRLRPHPLHQPAPADPVRPQILFLSRYRHHLPKTKTPFTNMKSRNPCSHPDHARPGNRISSGQSSVKA